MAASDGGPGSRGAAGALNKRRRRRVASAVTLALAAAVAVVLATGSGGSGATPPPRSSVLGTITTSSTSTTSTSTTRSITHTKASRAPAPAPHVLVTAPPLTATSGWQIVARVHGHPAVWLDQRLGVTLMRFDQRYVHLVLHTGLSDGGSVGWTYGDQISRAEIHLVVAAFNGGFKLTYANVGFESGGRVAVPLKAGLASVVTYTDGTTNIGSWLSGVPTRRKRVFSVLQNQRLLVDRGAAAATVASCVITCWGATIQNLTLVARSALGIDGAGRLVWAAGEQLSPATLAAALVSAGAERAIELDINPAWVDGYLYVHHAPGPTAADVVPGQRGIAGRFLAPYARDFFAIVAN